MPETPLEMAAVEIREHGGPEVLTYEDAPEPKIQADEVLVKVKACALNHLDLHIRAGLPGLKLDMPHILGSDAAGEGVAVGDVCHAVKPGDRILLAPGQASAVPGNFACQLLRTYLDRLT